MTRDAPHRQRPNARSPLPGHPPDRREERGDALTTPRFLTWRRTGMATPTGPEPPGGAGQRPERLSCARGLPPGGQDESPEAHGGPTESAPAPGRSAADDSRNGSLL